MLSNDTGCPSAPIQLSRDVNRTREMLSNDSAHHCINHNTYVRNTLPAIPPVTALQDSAGLLAVAAEIGIDISEQSSKALSNFNSQDYDAVISLCGCGVNLPEEWVLRAFQDWQLDDPEGQSIETFRRIRDEVKERVAKLIQSLN